MAAFAAAVLAALGGSVASGDSCPNAALRVGPSATLPDCRAYELVSPPFKAGQLPSKQFFDATTKTFLFSSLGAFGGAESNPSAGGTVYSAARGEAGWLATPIAPPASQFGFAGLISELLVDYNQGRGVFFDVRPKGATQAGGRIYLRQQSGTLTEVGALLPPEAAAATKPPGIFYEGASADLSHLLFGYPTEGHEPSFLWPGDATAHGQSLYEYVGTGDSEPALVGVKNDGPVQGNPHRNEGAELVSQCGITLGGSTGDSYNAVSETGSTVFFTATEGGCAGETPTGEEVIGEGPHVNELDARIDGSSTVALSEPSKADCASCDTLEADQTPANFEGASTDGSKAFFLSEQKMLSGAEGQSLYEYDFTAKSGERVMLLAPNVLGVARISQEGTHVYFVSTSVLASNEDATKEQAVPGAPNLYVLERDSQVPGGHVTFVTTLASGDEGDWNSQAALRGTRPVEATPDGRFLLFTSSNDSTPDASGLRPQLYRYDAQSSELLRVSIGAGGFNGNGNVEGNVPRFVVPAYNPGSPANPGLGSMSDDGQYIFFTSPAALTPQALDRVCVSEEEGECEAFAENIYDYRNGVVSLISDGIDRNQLRFGSTTRLLGTSPSGGDVFLTSADQLVQQDSDTQEDIYDARIGGGFPIPIASSSCEGEGCQGALSTLPQGQDPGSAAFVGPGNLPPLALKPSVSLVHKPATLTRPQKLAKALKACKKRTKRKRAACRARARRQFGRASRSGARGGK